MDKRPKSALKARKEKPQIKEEKTTKRSHLDTRKQRNNTVAKEKISSMTRILTSVAGLTIDQLFTVIIRLIFALKDKAFPKRRNTRRSIAAEAFCFSTLMAMTTAVLIAGYNGTHWEIPGFVISENTTFTNTTVIIQFPNDACLEGLDVEKNCPHLDHPYYELADADCKTTTASFYVQYQRCSRSSRATTPEVKHMKKRSFYTTINSEPEAIIRDIERCIRVFMRSHPFFLGIMVMMFLAMARTNILLAVCIVLALYAAPTFSYDLLKTQVIQGEGRSLISFTTASARTTHIALKSNITIDFEPFHVNISSKTTTRYLYQDCVQASTKSENSCGGGTTLLPEPYHGGVKFCENHVVQRGWLSGCGTFSAGTIKTCLVLNCSKEATVSRFNPESLIISSAIYVAGEKHEKTFVNDVHTTLDFGLAGLASIKCRLHEKWTSDYVFVENSHLGDFLELAEHVNVNWQGAYKVPGGHLMGLDRILTTTGVDVTEVKYKIVIPQYTTSGLEVQAPAGILPITSMSCELNTETIVIPKNDLLCDTLTFTKADETSPYSGLKSFSFSVKVKAVPCTLILDCAGGGCSGNSWYIKETESSIRVLAILADGENSITAGKFTFKYDHKRSFIVDYYQRITKEFTIAVEDSKKGFDYSFFSNFLRYQRLIIGLCFSLFLVFILPGPYKLLAVAALMGSFSIADIACGVDTGRGHMFCKSGLMIYDENNHGSNYYAIQDEKTINKFLIKMVKSYGVVNLICTSNIQCGIIDTVTHNMIGKIPSLTVNKNFDNVNIYQQFKGKPITISDGKMSVKMLAGEISRDPYGPVINTMSSTQAIDQESQNTFWIPFIPVGYTSRVFTALLKVAVDKNVTAFDGYCNPFKPAIGMKDDRIKFSDESMTINAFKGEFQNARVDQVIFCRRRPNATIGTTVEDSELIIPADIGGPPTAMNTIPTFKQPSGWPYHTPPYTIKRGMCPQTNVTVEPSCGKRGTALPSVDEEGDIIKEWCCRSCKRENLFHMIDHEYTCWMPSEVRPTPVKLLRSRRAIKVTKTKNHEDDFDFDEDDIVIEDEDDEYDISDISIQDFH